MRLGGPPVWTHRGITYSMYTMYTKTVQLFESELVPQVAGFVQQDDEKKKKKKDHLKINRRDTFGLL
jgi:general stress protein CsbA